MATCTPVSWVAIVCLIEPGPKRRIRWCLFQLDFFRSTLISICQTDVDRLMIRTQSKGLVRVRVRVVAIYIQIKPFIVSKSSVCVGVEVMHCRADAPRRNPTRAILNFFFLKN